MRRRDAPAVFRLRVAVLYGVAVLCGAADRAPACSFCGTGKSAPGPGQSMALADRTVWAKVVSRRLVFTDDLAAKSVAVFEVIRTHGGAAPAPGRRFQAVSPRGALGEAAGAVLMLALDKDKPDDITLLDAYPDAEGRLFDYLTSAADLPKFDHGKRIAFFVRRLEDEHPDIADDARRQFLDIPNKALREHKAALPVENLRAWLVSDKVAPMRKGLYGLMLGIAGSTADTDVLRAALVSVQQNVIGSGGVLVGLCLLTGKTDELLAGVLRDAARPAAQREGAVAAVRFFWDETDDDARKAELRALLRIAIADKDTAPTAISELALLGDFSLTEDVKAYWLDQARRSERTRGAVFRYRDSMPPAQREAFRRFLAANPDR